MKNNKKVATWKVVAVREWNKQRQESDGHINWSKIVRAIEEVEPKAFIGCASAGRKISDFIKRNESLVAQILEDLKNEEIPVETRRPAPATRTATTAHVDDEDKDTESESEVVSSTDVKEIKKNKDGSVTVDVEIKDDVDSSTLMNEDYLLRKLGYDPLVWEIVSSSCRKGEWDAQIKGGEIKKLYSYRVNANVKKREGSVCESALFDSFMSHLAEMNRPHYKMVEVEGENIAIVSIADLHLGKLAWHKECGANYDYSMTRSSLKR